MPRGRSPVDKNFFSGYHVNMIKRVSKKKALPSPDLDECMEVLRALSDRTRQEIISIFAEKGEACAGDIAAHFTLSRPAISHHLNLMRRSGLLTARKDGKEVYYSFNKDYVTGLLEALLSSIKGCC